MTSKEFSLKRKAGLYSLFIRVISTLEKIKTEASEIMQKVEETDIVLNEVEKVSHEYLPMAKACSSIFFTLSSLSTVRRQTFFT